jgi:hypothetical protein
LSWLDRKQVDTADQTSGADRGPQCEHCKADQHPAVHRDEQRGIGQVDHLTEPISCVCQLLLRPSRVGTLDQANDSIDVRQASVAELYFHAGCGPS